MKKFYWFGGSWITGDELQHQVPKGQESFHVFPKLISNHFEAECINLGANGSSISSLPLSFASQLEQFDSDSTVFFCLPPSHRVSLFDQQGHLRNILPSQAKEFHKIHDYADQWYKYFDNMHQRVYNHDIIINLLHFWCKSLDLKHYFFNDLWSHKFSIIDSTHDSNWLVGKKNSIAEFILPMVDKVTQDVIMEDGPTVSESEWQTQQEYIKRYIKPCYCHPNLEGHKKIAQELAKCIEISNKTDLAS